MYQFVPISTRILQNFHGNEANNLKILFLLKFKLNPNTKNC